MSHDIASQRRRLLLLSGLGGSALAAGPARAEAQTDWAHGGHHPPSLETRLTRHYGVRHPFVGAGMGFVALPSLVAAVSNAGGIGVLGNGIEPPPGTQALIQSIKATTARPFGVDFIFDDSAFGPLVTQAHIDVCVAERVRLVVFHMNVPPRAWVDRLHAAGARVWMQVASVAQALEAAAAGMDAVIAQGSQAGGHNKSTTRTLQLLPQVVRAVRPLMVLASGGIADGRGVVDALSHGADGVWVGTRLVASSEAHAHPEYQRRIVEARGHATVTTTLFGPEYPGRPYRVLRNRVVDEWAGREGQVPNPPPPPAVIGSTLLFPLTLKQNYSMPKFSAIVPTPETSGDFEEMGLPAGSESVKFIKRVQPAAEIVREMMEEAQALIRVA
ncbi:nitronate monooxygenase family protein [Rhizobacter sp. Root16D2]|uniref:NAD(P)H-dependent flavin oxidoreductase n=1 Tax=Rhizobacter sp. Root16D2 TaxID=1736479 RepID=UPI0009EBC7AA|nr:nitronate monooxygenase [Rhizobacter sp. Root16D2]